MISLLSKPYLWLWWGLIILILCHLPGKSIPSFKWQDLFGFDKVVHFILYFFLVGFLYLDTKSPAWRIFNNKGLLGSVLISILLGIFIELSQHFFLKDRYFELLDIIANIAGALIGIALFRNLKKLNNA